MDLHDQIQLHTRLYNARVTDRKTPRPFSTPLSLGLPLPTAPRPESAGEASCLAVNNPRVPIVQKMADKFEK